jgi:hypothetical protein
MERQSNEKREEDARKRVDGLAIEYWDNNPSAGGVPVREHILNHLRNVPGWNESEFYDAVKSSRTYDRMKAGLDLSQPRERKAGAPPLKREASLYYEWPKSHENEAYPLPWETAGVAGEIQGFYDRLIDAYETAVQMGYTGVPYLKQVTNRQVLWAHRLRAADSTCPTDWLAHASEVMALHRLMDGFVMAGARPETDHLVMNHERRIQMELRFKVWTPEGKARYDEQEVIAGNYEPMGYVNPTAAQRRIAGLGDEAKEFNVYITKWGDPRRGELHEIKFEGRPRGFSTLAFTDEIKEDTDGNDKPS